MLSAIIDRDAMDALTAERAVVQALGGGCQMPLGAHATLHDGQLTVRPRSSRPTAARSAAKPRGDRSNAAALGESLADELLGRGAGEILGF